MSKTQEWTLYVSVILAFCLIWHASFRGIDCSMRILGAREDGRTYTYEQCYEARAREGKWESMYTAIRGLMEEKP